MTRTSDPVRRIRAWRLAGRMRKLVLLCHILAAGVWIGLDVAMAVLVFVALGADSLETQGFCLQALSLVTVWPMLTAATVSLASGLALGLGSKYGVIRYWWVAVKLALNVALAVLLVASLRGGVRDAADAGALLSRGIEANWARRDLTFPPIVAPSALLLAFVLSVFKPWGRTHWVRVRAPRELTRSD